MSWPDVVAVLGVNLIIASLLVAVYWIRNR